MDHVRAAFRCEVLEGEAQQEEAGEVPGPRRPSEYDSKTLGEQRWFWALCTLAPLSHFPAGDDRAREGEPAP